MLVCGIRKCKGVTTTNRFFLPTLEEVRILSSTRVHSMKASAAALVVFCVAAYGVSLYVNGGSTGLSLPITLLLVGATRCLTLLAVSAALALSGGACSRSSTLPPLSPRQVATPVLVALVANTGFVPYSLLASGSSFGTVLAPLVSLYVAVPVVYGVLFARETFTARKAAGVALSLCATLLLAFAPAPSGGDAGAPSPSGASLNAASCLALFVCVVACWGVGDIGATFMGRGLPLLATALLSACGQALTAAVYGLAVAIEGGSGGGTRAQVGAVCGANVLGVLGWAAFVYLGSYGSEASSLSPLVALYVFVPVALSVSQGASVGAWQWVGMAAAAVAGLLIASSWAESAPPPLNQDVPAVDRAALSVPPGAPAEARLAALGAGSAADEGWDTAEVAETEHLTQGRQGGVRN